MKLSFVVPGPPRPWQRAASRNGKRFTPKAMREYQSSVGANAAFAAGQVAYDWPFDGRYSLALVVTPKTAVRADLDNYCKTVMDALTGVLWNDDSQVDVLHVQRGAKDSTSPYLAVTVEVL